MKNDFKPPVTPRKHDTEQSQSCRKAQQKLQTKREIQIILALLQLQQFDTKFGDPFYLKVALLFWTVYYRPNLPPETDKQKQKQTPETQASPRRCMPQSTRRTCWDHTHLGGETRSQRPTETRGWLSSPSYENSRWKSKRPHGGNENSVVFFQCVWWETCICFPRNELSKVFSCWFWCIFLRKKPYLNKDALYSRVPGSGTTPLHHPNRRAWMHRKKRKFCIMKPQI